jgi:hypothetical protein
MLRRRAEPDELAAALWCVRNQLRREWLHSGERRVAVCLPFGRERRLLVRLLRDLVGDAVRVLAEHLRHSPFVHSVSKRGHMHDGDAPLLLSLLT